MRASLTQAGLEEGDAIGCLDDLLAVFLFLDHFIGEVDILDIEYPHIFLINVCATRFLEVEKVTENIYFSKI